MQWIGAKPLINGFAHQNKAKSTPNGADWCGGVGFLRLIQLTVRLVQCQQRQFALACGRLINSAKHGPAFWRNNPARV
jgi:hypothetical protein